MLLISKYTHQAIFTVSLILMSGHVQGQIPPKKDAPTELTESMFSVFKPRNIGPAFTSGRVVSFAVDPKNRSSYYAAAGSGGVWKTTNNGSTWSPVFEHEGSYSIGTVVLDPNNSNVVWVGSGENNAQRSVGYGDGVYKSVDGGKSWKNVGLKTSEHIGKIVVDPRDSNIVFVAAQGPLWSAGGDRGLFRSIDGGKTWTNVLKINENTGVTDVEIDPKNPDVMYAASYQRRRHVWTLIDGGPESAIYKSTDGGDTWNKLRGGIPGGELGRIGLAVSPVDSSVIFATIEAAGKLGGLFRSGDFGASWERRNEFVSQGMYYAQVIADPKDVERVYILGVVNQVSDDGGRTVHALGERAKHVDNHALWIDPKDTNYILAGCDGGIYDSYDKGATWQFKSNLPIAQFYDLAVDNNAPFYYVYGGTQDNSSVGGPSRTRNAAGIVSSDWIVTAGGDGFHQQVDPTDADTVYSESQYGGLVRFNKKNGERVGIQPLGTINESPLRWNWDSPFIISPFNHSRLYFAANKLFRSDDRGNTWKAVSPDLSRQLDRNSLRVMDKIWNSDAIAKHQSTSFYGNITALAESPRQEGLLFAGTDDGLIQTSSDSGNSWQLQDKFPGVPDKSYVSRIFPSQFDAQVLYAAFENHKMGDYVPYLLKSVDKGKNWVSISANLPANGSVLAFAEDHVQSNLLFVGTEFGLYTSINGGIKWLKVGALPTIPVRDIVIQKQMNDLVIGTFGRGIYVIDDYSNLRNTNVEMFKSEAALLPARMAHSYLPASAFGGRGSLGETFYSAPNPPFGAALTYYLRSAPKTLKQVRQEIERDAEAKKIVAPYPSVDQLRAEEQEEPSAVVITINSSDGKPVRKLNAPATSGLNRVYWDLRVSAPIAGGGGNARRVRQDGEDGVQFTPSGPLTIPGEYTATMAIRHRDVETSIPGSIKIIVVSDTLANSDAGARSELNSFLQKAGRLQASASALGQTATDLLTRLGSMKRAVRDYPSTNLNLVKLSGEISDLELKTEHLLLRLNGDSFGRGRDENVAASISDRIGHATSAGSTTQPPNGSHKEALAAATKLLATEMDWMRSILKKDVPSIEKQMNDVGVPWTPGRLPEIRGND